MTICNSCIHEEICLITALDDVFENTPWDKKACCHFRLSEDIAEVKQGQTNEEELDKIV